MARSPELSQALSDLGACAEMATVDWAALLQLANRASLLGRLAAQERELPRAHALPERVRGRLQAAATQAEFHQRGVCWEVDRVGRALRGLDVQAVLLKGAAYVLAELPVARGRVISDVDILVPRDALSAVEQALLRHGWEPLLHDEYDDHYYRAWMHELPPLRHRVRGAVIDVHHTILPPTGRLRPDPQRLLTAARPLPNGWWVLAPEDMVLHAAAHLFQDGEVAGGLRQLSDLDWLLRGFDRDEPGFWERLVPRAAELQLGRPLYYAVRYCQSELGTKVPPAVTSGLQAFAPPPPLRALMDLLVAATVWPGDTGSSWRWASWGTRPATLLLYIRSHWLRMPPGLLARHLAHKAWSRWFPDESTAASRKPRR